LRFDYFSRPELNGINERRGAEELMVSVYNPRISFFTRSAEFYLYLSKNSLVIDKSCKIESVW